MKAEEIRELEQQVIYHKALYYKGEAVLSDAEYDALEDKLRSLAPDSQALELVGSALLSKDMSHTVPMLSLGKTRNPADILEWLQADLLKERKTQAQSRGVAAETLPLAFERGLVSVKMDGSSASLIYQDGRFVQAKTRGDGFYGENITPQMTFVNFPKELVFPGNIKNFEIRGEVCISRQNFGRLSEALNAKEQEAPKSIRNIVAGLLHTKFDTAAITNCSYLDFIGYEIICDELAITEEVEKFKILAAGGFIVPPYWPLEKAEQFQEIIEEYRQFDEESFDYLSDGLVIAVADLARQRARGRTAHHPKGKMAFKFQAESTTTTLREIEMNIGRTGKLSFVGLVEPVQLSGATVSRVTLHNSSYIEAERLGLGAVIEICRSGEVIPKHERTIEPAPVPLLLPDKCPYCGTILTRSSTGIDLLCTNESCPGRLLNSLLYFISAVGIEFIGERTLRRLMETGIIKNIADLFRLTVEKLAVLKMPGSTTDKQEQKIIASIDEHRRIPLSTFLVAVGIDGFGLNAVKLLTARYPNVAALKNITPENIMEISGLGKVLAQNIQVGLKERAWPLMAELEQIGVVVVQQIASGPLKDKNIVITGSLQQGNRKQLEAKIEAAGGNFSNSVGRKTDYLVCNNPSNSSKYQKALSLGVKIITEEDLYRLMAGSNETSAAVAEPEESSNQQQLSLF